MNSDAHSQMSTLINGTPNQLAAAYAASLENRKRKFFTEGDQCDFTRPESEDDELKRRKVSLSGGQSVQDIPGTDGHISSLGKQSSKSHSSTTVNLDEFCNSAQDLSVNSKLKNDDASDMDDISEMEDNDDELDIEKCAKPFEDVSEDDDDGQTQKEDTNKDTQDIQLTLEKGVDHFFKSAQFSPILDVNGDDSMRFLQDANSLVN